MTRTAAITRSERQFDSGEFKAVLARRIAIPTESQNPERGPELARYLGAELQPAFESMGFECRTLTHSKAKAPFLFAQRLEDPALPTVFGYGHGDVIRGLEPEWKEGLSPWALIEREGRWYGRGIADNKGQHSVNMQALANVLAERGRLGFNAKAADVARDVPAPAFEAIGDEFGGHRLAKRPLGSAMQLVTRLAKRLGGFEEVGQLAMAG